MKRLYQIAIAVAFLSAACSKGENPDPLPDPPVITLDSPTAIYPAKAGREIEIRPSYEHAEDATFVWTLDGERIGSEPALRFSSEKPGQYFITLTVTNKGGMDEEELRVDVFELTPPTISLPGADKGFTLLLGSELELKPVVASSLETTYSWTIDGKEVSNEPAYTFRGDARGDFAFALTTRNEDGEDAVSFMVGVRLPEEVDFSWTIEQSTCNVSLGRTILLRAVEIENAFDAVYTWSVDGQEVQRGDKAEYAFTASEEGAHTVKLEMQNEYILVSHDFTVNVCPKEGTYYRARTAASNAACNKVYEMFVRAEKLVVMNMPVMQFTVYACILGISWLGANMIVGGSLTTGELMSLLTYCMNILMSLMMLSMVFVMVTMSAASAERVTEVINETADLHDPQDPVMEVADGSIEFDHVDFSYKKDSKEPVLKDINLSIRAGETIGIIGGTGSAKSSLVNLISRLYDVSSGSVKVGGVDVRDYHMDSLRNQVAVVLQKNVLFSGTILENLRWGNKEASEKECRRACQLSCADDFIEKMPDKYNTYIEQGGTNVSGGQKQRLCIARALLKKPKVLILDDSTSAVDTATDARIRRAFAEEIPDTTKLIIAQRISSIQSADRIIVMDEGKISGFGTHEELMKTNAIYQEVYNSQIKGGGDFDENRGGEQA